VRLLHRAPRRESLSKDNAKVAVPTQETTVVDIQVGGGQASFTVTEQGRGVMADAIVEIG